MVKNTKKLIDPVANKYASDQEFLVEQAEKSLALLWHFFEKTRAAHAYLKTCDKSYEDQEVALPTNPLCQERTREIIRSIEALRNGFMILKAENRYPANQVYHCTAQEKSLVCHYNGAMTFDREWGKYVRPSHEPPSDTEGSTNITKPSPQACNICTKTMRPHTEHIVREQWFLKQQGYLVKLVANGINAWRKCSDGCNTECAERPLEKDAFILEDVVIAEDKLSQALDAFATWAWYAWGGAWSRARSGGTKDTLC